MIFLNKFMFRADKIFRIDIPYYFLFFFKEGNQSISSDFVIFMNKNFVNSENVYLSPLLPQLAESPYLSPFMPNFRKLSDDLNDLIGFRLEDNPLQEQQQQQQEEQEHSNFQDRLCLDADIYRNCREIKQEDSDDERSPDPSHRCEVPSTKFQQIKQENQPPYFVLSSQYAGQPKVQAMIDFLVLHSQLKQELLLMEGRRFQDDNPAIRQVFKILAGKFKKLKKTKEEMTKYCMRKAFKFVSDRSKKDRSNNRDLDYSMRQYFQQNQTAINFSIPFKKNSTQKTMNGSFLKRVFSCQQFCEDYKDFIVEFKALMIEDNQKKVKYLTELVQEALNNGEIAKVQTIKRLPWTEQILQQTYQLAISLADHQQHDLSARRSRKQQE